MVLNEYMLWCLYRDEHENKITKYECEHMEEKIVSYDSENLSCTIIVYCMLYKVGTVNS